MSPFDVASHLNEKTRIESSDVLHDYNPWMINSILSNNMQTIMFANMMNKFYTLPKTVQYDFYFHGIPKGKRYGKWNKKIENSDDINILCEIFHINAKVASQYMSLMNNEQLNIIRTMKGGNHGKHGGSRDTT